MGILFLLLLIPPGMSIRCYDDFIEDEDLRPVGQKECRKGTLSCEKSVIEYPSYSAYYGCARFTDGAADFCKEEEIDGIKYPRCLCPEDLCNGAPHQRTATMTITLESSQTLLLPLLVQIYYP